MSRKRPQSDERHKTYTLKKIKKIFTTQATTFSIIVPILTAIVKKEKKNPSKDINCSLSS